jgi:hypothetical protein
MRRADISVSIRRFETRTINTFTVEAQSAKFRIKGAALNRDFSILYYCFLLIERISKFLTVYAAPFSMFMYACLYLLGKSID